MDQSNTLKHAQFNWGWAIVVFFVVLALGNSLLLFLAVSSNPGTLVENPYDEGLRFQGEIEARELFRAKGYTLALTPDLTAKGKFSAKIRSESGAPVRGISGNIRFVFPGDHEADRICEVKLVSDTQYFQCDVELPRPGLWIVDAELKEGTARISSRDTRMLTF